MNLSELCKQAVLFHGILMNGDEPAGAHLLNLETMHVTVAQSSYSEALLTPQIKDHIQFDISTPDQFPEGIEEAIRRAIGSWYIGNIEFVDANENPDLRIIAYEGDGRIGGFASWPINDNAKLNEIGQPQFRGLSTAIIGIDMTSQRFSQKYAVTNPHTLLEGVEQTITHEFGHNLGIRHANETAYHVKEETPSFCTENEIIKLAPLFRNSHMFHINDGSRTGTELDVFFSKTIQGETSELDL